MMNGKRTIAFLGLVGAVAVLLAAPWSIVAGGDDSDDNQACKPKGNYIGVYEDTRSVWTMTVIPDDPAGKELTTVCRFGEADPTIFGWFPEVDATTDYVGKSVRTGKNTYDHTLVGYGTKRGGGFIGQIVYIWVMSGTARYTNDCNTVEAEFTCALFTADQDGNFDGIPDEGQEPIVIIPETAKGHRLHTIPPYLPTP